MLPELRRDCTSGLGLLPLEQRALPFAMVRVVAYDTPVGAKDFGPDTSAQRQRWTETALDGG